MGRAVPAPGLPKSLQQVHLHAAGVDCGATEHFIAVPEDRDPQPVRAFSTFTADLIALADWYASQHIQHMQKARMRMNVPLHHVIDAITGLTGRRVIEAILAGERDPQKLARLRHERCQHNEATIALALQGNWREEHLCALQQAVELYRFYHEKLDELDKRIQASLQTFAEQSQGEVLDAHPRQCKLSNNEPRFDVRQYLCQMTGVDLMTSDGFRTGSLALDLSAEIGMDRHPWPTEQHFCSWLCLCSGSQKTGGRLISGRTRTNASRAARSVRLAAYALGRSQTALGAFYRRLKARLGLAKALTATAHKLAKRVYNMLRYDKAYVDRARHPMNSNTASVCSRT